MPTRLLALAIVIFTPLTALGSSPDSVFSAYIRAVLSENWPAAEALWLPDEVALAKRLDIVFTGMPLKVDCASPLQEHRAALANGTITYAVIDSLTSDTLAARIIEIRSGESALRHTYLLIPTKDGWRITSPIYHITRAWPVRKTRFATIRCPDSSLLNDYAVEALDSFIDSLGMLFYFETEHWIRLGRERIEYYLADREIIKPLTGYDAHGMTYLPLDAVLSSHLPHDHELTHALMNFRLRTISLYTLPALQEGIAVACGGRWGKAPSVIMNLGAFVLKSEIMTVDDILTYQGFNSDASDLSYALGGLLSRCLIESIGFPKFALLYRRLSGPQQYIRGLSVYEIHKAVEETTNQPWELLVPACVEREVDIFSQRGIDPCDSLPESAIPWSTVNPYSWGLSWAEDSSHYYFQLSHWPGGRAALLFEDRHFDAARYRSRLFSEQFPEQKYAGEALGIVFDTLEAGVYDYRTDMLLAKFASGFSQGESIWDTKGQVVRFRVDKGIIPIELGTAVSHLIWVE